MVQGLTDPELPALEDPGPRLLDPVGRPGLPQGLPDGREQRLGVLDVERVLARVARPRCEHKPAHVVEPRAFFLALLIDPGQERVHAPEPLRVDGRPGVTGAFLAPSFRTGIQADRLVDRGTLAGVELGREETERRLEPLGAPLGQALRERPEVGRRAFRIPQPAKEPHPLEIGPAH